MLNIVVLVSGGGTNLQALIDASEQGRIPGGAITCVISSRPDAYALKRAKNHGIPTRVLCRKEYADVHAYSKAMVEALKEEKAGLVIYAGFMTILDEQVVRAFPNKMMNVHPALIPSFCGKNLASSLLYATLTLSPLLSVTVTLISSGSYCATTTF